MDDGDEFLATEFSAVETLNRSLPRTATRLDACYTNAVELMASLDSLSHEVASSLDRTLEYIEKSEKRLPNEIELLENDASAFETSQHLAGEQLLNILTPALESPVLAEMARLDSAIQRVNQVLQILNNAKALDAESLSATVTELVEAGDVPEAERLVRDAEQAAAVFKGTSEEQSKVRVAAALRQRLPASSSSTSAGNLLSKFQLI